MKVETEVGEAKLPAQHHSARHGGVPDWPPRHPHGLSHPTLLTAGVEQRASGSALLAHPPFRGERWGAGVLGVGESGIESANGCHLLLTQVKPQEMPRASVRLFPSHKLRGNYPMCQQAGSSQLAGRQWQPDSSPSPSPSPSQSPLPPPPPSPCLPQLFLHHSTRPGRPRWSLRNVAFQPSSPVLS